MFKDTDKIKRFEKHIYLSSPKMHGEEAFYVNRAIEQNWVSCYGENIDKVEEFLNSKFEGGVSSVLLSSGTAGLHLALIETGIREGDKVACSDLTFVATANAINYLHATPIFVDSEQKTWNMDSVALEKAFKLYPDIKAVLVTNLYGTPSDLDKIIEVSKRFGAKVIVDGAESFGSLYKNRNFCDGVDFWILSFNGNKIITGSTGGAVISKNHEAIAHIKKLSTQAKENVPWYEHAEIGYNYRMSNIVAGIVRGQLQYLDEHIKKKTKIYNTYKEGLKELKIKLNPYKKSTMLPNFWLSSMLINKEALSSFTMGESEYSYKKESKKTCPMEIYDVLKSFNVDSRPIFKPMHLEPIFRDEIFVYLKENSVSADLFNRGLCLPSDVNMTELEQEKIIEIIKLCFQ